MSLLDILQIIAVILTFLVVAAFVYSKKQNKLISTLRKVTGLSEPQINDRLRDVEISNQDLLYFAARYARFPDHEEQEYIKLHGLSVFMEHYQS